MRACPHAAAAKRAQSTPPKCSVDSTVDRYSPVHSELAGVCLCVCVYVCVLQVVGVAGGVPEAGAGWLSQGGRAEQDSLSTAGAAAQRWGSCWGLAGGLGRDLAGGLAGIVVDKMHVPGDI